MTTELVVRTITFEPAKIEFNFDQLSKILDANLVKYTGLEFTEKTVGDCKKTIAELRKGKTLLDTYRKDTKKQLTESITEFENRIKELGAKFDAVIDPLTAQHDQFEHNRRERKRVEIQQIIEELILQQGLNEKFAAQLVEIPEEYFNKGKDLKEIKKELTAKAESLGVAQDKEAADMEIIKTKVELANAKHGVELVETPYINLLAHGYSIADIVEKINMDAEELKRRMAPKVDTVPSTPAPVASTVTSASDSISRSTQLITVTGTDAQLDALELYLEQSGIEWDYKND